ncbi:hypothetical protein DFH07DRAFT_963021 [Mycena maculata]|uniref:Uncharacterized protein n=1 Tax=Mycena maculata TaxID=230809 RepID=A0AAD7ING6_9AGAR|nr:hypothetical protein DFH07DRAFT_963021 [Mycena maculata]
MVMAWLNESGKVMFEWTEAVPDDIGVPKTFRKLNPQLVQQTLNTMYTWAEEPLKEYLATREESAKRVSPVFPLSAVALDDLSHNAMVQAKLCLAGEKYLEQKLRTSPSAITMQLDSSSGLLLRGPPTCRDFGLLPSSGGCRCAAPLPSSLAIAPPLPLPSLFAVAPPLPSLFAIALPLPSSFAVAPSLPSSFAVAPPLPNSFASPAPISHSSSSSRTAL